MIVPLGVVRVRLISTHEGVWFWLTSPAGNLRHRMSGGNFWSWRHQTLRDFSFERHYFYPHHNEL